MIRYGVTLRKLHALIEAAAPGWLKEAAVRAARFKTARRYEEPPEPNWGRIRDVYRGIQFHKCAYCERQLPISDKGSIEHDVEHFRPKRGVKAWPPPGAGKPRYTFSTGGDFTSGYYLLAYHPLNYAMACKTCNTSLKANYFPVAGRRGRRTAANPRSLATEKPLLIYPIGTIDIDPRRVITFHGVTPEARSRRGHNFRRAQVTIDFFDLDGREELWRGRAQGIALMYQELDAAERGVEHYVQEQLDLARIGALPHANCVLAFYDLWQSDRAEATNIALAARKYLVSQQLA